MIVGILGYIGSGKDTVAQKLLKNHNFKKDSFAHSLKDACAVMFDWPRHMLEGDTKESRTWRETTDPWWSEKLNISNFTPRLALQLVGTDALRNHFHEDIWLLSHENRLRKNPDVDVAISDARFQNEIEMIRRHNGILIQVKRGKEPEWASLAALANAGNPSAEQEMLSKYSYIHKSEWAWAGTKVDYIIDNNGTLDDLDEQINNIVVKIRSEKK